ncbi:VanW family protein [Cytophagales bacterium LB-30]|uniref:VanW family protein n=1 Tax=Shiella aurantiaca TaxID=3058365 RepID=A0ABT8F6U4_9BACT|nr:VanW family protein [Shiella aurantiaca]MDN4166192.1 VanW family protein [Shiella aurantiaca]
MYYRAARAIVWLWHRKSYAKTRSGESLPHLVKDHQSFLLRPLKDVQMRLQYNKITNLMLAIACIDGLIIRPGETFSIWRLVGKPSTRKGYLPGLVLNQGKIEEGIGGGLCQLGNLIFWMVLHTPLSIKERYRHGYDVFPDINRKIPFGAGATLSYNYIDLQIKNETQQAYQLKLWLSDEHLHGAIFCEQPPQEYYEVYEAHHRIVHQWWGGYTRHNQIKRRVYHTSSHELLRDEWVLENHAIMMYEPLLSAGQA